MKWKSLRMGEVPRTPSGIFVFFTSTEFIVVHEGCIEVVCSVCHGGEVGTRSPDYLSTHKRALELTW